MKPVAAMTASASTGSGEPSELALVWTTKPLSTASTRSMAAFRMYTPLAMMWSSTGCTYRARMPTSEFVSTEVRAGRGEARTIRWA